MNITLEKNAIVLKIEQNSVNLSVITYFIQNSFKDVKHFLNLIVISDGEDEWVRKRYLLKWAYKIYFKEYKSSNCISLKQLSQNSHLPIHVVKSDTNSVEKILSITVDHINSNNELRITCNQYDFLVVQKFKALFKDSMVSSVEKRIFTIKIKTKNDLNSLRSIISRKKISGTSVVFITHGLNFSKLTSKENISQEQAYINKLKKSYRILSITSSSTAKEIKNNYKKMLRKYHPDRVGNEGLELVELYTRRFQVIQEAYAFVKEYRQVA